MMAAAGLIHLDARKSGARNDNNALVRGEGQRITFGGSARPADRLAVGGCDVELVGARNTAQVTPMCLELGGAKRSKRRQNAKSKTAKYVFHSEPRVSASRMARGLPCGTFVGVTHLN